MSKTIVHGLYMSLIELLIAHKNAVEVAGILHRDVSLVNLFLTYTTQSNHMEFVQKMSGLSANAQVELCERIGNVKQQGVLGDWGYTVPMTEHSTGTASPDVAADPPTLSIKMPSQTADKSTNCVLAIPVFSNNVQPALTLVPELMKDHDIVLAMGPQASAESDPRHTIDTSPLYCMVRSTFFLYEVT